MFKKNKKTVVELKNGKEVVYRVALSEKQAEIQSAAGDWSTSYGNTSFEYGMINYLIKDGFMDELIELCRVTFMARMFFHDTKLIKEFYKECERAGKRMAAKKPDQQDAEILAEEKVLHEQTEESVVELEEIRKKHGKK